MAEAPVEVLSVPEFCPWCSAHVQRSQEALFGVCHVRGLFHERSSEKKEW